MKNISIPKSFLKVHYDGQKYPGHATGLGGGSNCQHFAYELLRYFGKTIPNFRSSNLWEDTKHTKRVKILQSLDLLLFNHTRNSWGAHVGVYIGNGKIIHLCKEVGRPAIWTMHDFKVRDRYRAFIGAKRAIDI